MAGALGGLLVGMLGVFVPTSMFWWVLCRVMGEQKVVLRRLHGGWGDVGGVSKVGAE